MSTTYMLLPYLQIYESIFTLITISIYAINKKLVVAFYLNIYTHTTQHVLHAHTHTHKHAISTKHMHNTCRLLYGANFQQFSNSSKFPSVAIYVYAMLIYQFHFCQIFHC